MMEFNVSNLCGDYSFYINGVSYIGKPRNNTVMYVTKKVEGLIDNLKQKKQCVIFAENTILVPEDFKKDNLFILTESPQRDYAVFVEKIANEAFEENRKRKYKMEDGGFFIGENVIIGKNAYIEQGCVIGHDVIIGNNCRILSGTIIKDTVVGDDFFANEKAVIGASGFTMTEDDNGNKVRIPTLGKVVIGNNVEIGANNNISRGSAGDTVIEDNVKIDALVYIGHDAHLRKNVEITANCSIGGFSVLDEKSYIGLGAIVRNRVSVGRNVIVGMGAVVTSSVPDDITVVGNPAKLFEKKR